MIWELVYTSLEHGLKGGKSGFGIAAATVGIPEVVARMLCTGSGYTPFYPPHTPEYNSNPVSDFHSLARIGDTTWHWVGRIRAWGMDYSGRSNLLAHHLLFTPDEISGALPETLLDDCARLGLIDPDTFTGPARWLEPLKSLPPGRNSSGGGAWRDALGDPGWAGVPAECAAAGRAPVYIAVNPDADVRAMLRESMRLMPPEMRWRVTYNTYYTRASGDVRCDWRFCINGDRLLTAARRQPGITVIDGDSPPPVTAWTRFAVGAGPSPAGAFRDVSADMDEDFPIPVKPSRAVTAGSGTPPPSAADTPEPEASFREIRWSRWTFAWIMAALLMLAAGVWVWLRRPPEGLFDVPDFEGTAVGIDVSESAASVPVAAVDFPLPDGGGEAGEDLPVERLKEPPAVSADGRGENADAGSTSRGRGKIIISSQREEARSGESSAAAPPVLPPSPEVMRELPGRIWRLCAVGGPGESAGLGSALVPEVQLIPKAAVNRMKDGSLTVTLAAENICTFRAPDNGSGEWRLEVSDNFLPGLSGFSGISWQADTAARPVTMTFEGCMLSVPGRLEYDRGNAAGLAWMDDGRLTGLLESSGVLAGNGLEFFPGGVFRPDPDLAARIGRCRADMEEYERKYLAENSGEIARLTAGSAEIAALRDSYRSERMEDLAELESQRPAEMVRPTGNPPDEIRRRWLNYERQLKAWNKKYDDFNRETEKALAVFDENLSWWQSALAAARARAEEIVYPEELCNEVALINSELDRKAALWEGMESLRIIVADGIFVEIVSGRGQ